MSGNVSCGICLNSEKNILSIETVLFNRFFLHFRTNDNPDKIWLCVWCKAAVHNATKLIKLALTSQEILAKSRQTITNYKSGKNNKGPYTLSYYSSNHIDIPPCIKENCAQNEIDEIKSIDKINNLLDEENETELIEETIVDKYRDVNKKSNRKRRMRTYKTLAVYCKSDDVNKNDEKIDDTISTVNTSKNEKHHHHCIEKSNILDDATDVNIIKKEPIENDENAIDEFVMTNKEHVSLIDENKLPELNIGKKNRVIDYKSMNFEVKFLNFHEQLKEIKEKRKSEKYKSRKYKCEQCGKGFLTNDIFCDHIKRHEKSAGEHECRICTLRFKSQQVLSQHMLAHRRRFACLLCHAVFKRWLYCVDHRHMCGTSPSPAVCGQCNKLFQTHTGDKPFSCDVCARTFASNSNLRAHMAVHTSDKTHYCVECNTYYKTAKSLKSHLINSVKHRPRDLMFPCTECDKQFSTEKILQSHVNTIHMHLESVYNCTFCTKTFSNNSNLNKHLRHTHGTSTDE